MTYDFDLVLIAIPKAKSGRIEAGMHEVAVYVQDIRHLIEKPDAAAAMGEKMLTALAKQAIENGNTTTGKPR